MKMLIYKLNVCTKVVVLLQQVTVCSELRVVGEVRKAGEKVIAASAGKTRDLSRIQLDSIRGSSSLGASETSKLSEEFSKISLSFWSKNEGQRVTPEVKAVLCWGLA